MNLHTNPPVFTGIVNPNLVTLIRAAFRGIYSDGNELVPWYVYDEVVKAYAKSNHSFTGRDYRNWLKLLNWLQDLNHISCEACCTYGGHRSYCKTISG